ncbi:aldehyde dehydrogenase family protein, partial [Acinetobacter baumannii]
HIYVHASVKDELVARFRAHLDTLYGEGRQAMHADLTRVINERHTRRIGELLSDATSRGAKVLYGGTVDVGAHFVSPTLLGDIPADARIMQ